MRLDDDDFVRGQYGSTAKLTARIAVWHPDDEGRWPQDVAVTALAELKPGRLLEVGCGTCAFAERCASELGCEVIALDASPEMVAATRARGIDAVVGDVQHLPFDDAEFNGAIAAWMLYHVPDRDLAIGELARVLRPDGRLIAITTGREHLADLWQLVGATKYESSFSRENGQEQLERHFGHVERHDVQSKAVFADRAATAAYMATLDRGARRAAPGVHGAICRARRHRRLRRLSALDQPPPSPSQAGSIRP